MEEFKIGGKVVIAEGATFVNFYGYDTPALLTGEGIVSVDARKTDSDIFVSSSDNSPGTWVSPQYVSHVTGHDLDLEMYNKLSDKGQQKIREYIFTEYRKEALKVAKVIRILENSYDPERTGIAVSTGTDIYVLPGNVSVLASAITKWEIIE